MSSARSARSLALAALSVALVSAACGGGATKSATKAASVTTPGVAPSHTASTVADIGTSSSGTGGSFKVRVVNFYAPSDHPQGLALDGYFTGDTNPNPKDGVGKADFASVGYGQTSDYKGADPSKLRGLTLFVPGAADPVALQNLIGSAAGRITVLTYWIGQAGNAATAVFDEMPSAKNVAEKFPDVIPAAPSGKALLVAAGGPLMNVDKGGAYNVGQPGKGCFALLYPDGPSSGHTTTPAGGSLTYLADPGALQVAWFGPLDTDCTQAPVIPPASVTVAASDRMIVVGYGTTTSSLHLSIVPIRVLPGDPALVGVTPPTTVAPTLRADPCSLFTNDAAATALGAAVSGSTGDKSAGTCSYTAGAATLGVALQSDMTKEAFDALRSSATGAQPVTGIGDQAYLTTGPVSIVVLKASIMLAIGLDHHADSGPDDPNVDAPLLKSLAAEAIQHL